MGDWNFIVLQLLSLTKSYFIQVAIIHDIICSLLHKCHPKSYHSDINYPMTIIFSVDSSKVLVNSHFLNECDRSCGVVSCKCSNQCWSSIFFFFFFFSIWKNIIQTSIIKISHFLILVGYGCLTIFWFLISFGSIYLTT